VSSCGSCISPYTCGGGGQANACGGSSCSFTVTTNAYDHDRGRGVISFKNNGPATASNYKIEFDIPSGQSCTIETVPFRATLSPLVGSGTSARTASNRCVYTFANPNPLPPGNTRTFYYSVSASSLSSATNVVVTDSLCRL
jgi:hypothetical protein